MTYNIDINGKIFYCYKEKYLNIYLWIYEFK